MINSLSKLIYVCVCLEACLNWYISITTWPPQTKISNSAPERNNAFLCDKLESMGRDINKPLTKQIGGVVGDVIIGQ